MAEPLDAPLAALAPKSRLRALGNAAAACALAPLALALTPLLLTAAIAALAALAVFRPALIRGLPRDLRFVGRLVAATRQLNGRLNRTRGRFTVADYWQETVLQHADKEALIFGERVYTYLQVDKESDRIAHWALQRGLRPGDGVALLCSNRPEHLFVWLGMSKLGISTTLINPSLRGASLEHALQQCSIKLLIFDAPSTPILSSLNLGKGATAFEFVCLDGAVAEAPPPPLSPMRSSCLSTDAALLIFTSGTTGLPKAAKVNHIRFFSAIVLPYMFEMKPSDRFYCCLPMCHTAAVGAISMSWWLGAPVILAPKFSASAFWKDCYTHRATIVQYVGELCRYLVNSPPTEYDRNHGVRLAFGNGLRPDVWDRFKSRFGLERIAEVYASTEGNANLANTEGKAGAVGFISPLLAPMYPVKLVKVIDAESGERELLRGHNGLCVPCKPGEAGELLGLVNQRDASRNFAGYTDRAATLRKLVRDVVKKGDCWFRTGDLLRSDDEGFVYFVDRMGDTFRYKGENVSTAEVGAALGKICSDGVAQVLVYGVQLPAMDGRVGMAALSTKAEGTPIDFKAVYTGLEDNLPSYAAPRFLRVLSPNDEIEMTITFKPRKESLVAAGISDDAAGSVYVRDASNRTYTPLTSKIRNEITAGKYVLS